MNHTISIAIVVSRFNEAITEKLRAGAVETLINQGVSPDKISIVPVPGAVEIPLTAQLLAKTKQYDAIIALGAVIRGDTDHYDYVCQQVSYGCQHVMLTHSLPVIFGILTTGNEQQAEDRVDINKSHKGVEAAVTALEMIAVVRGVGVNGDGDGRS